MVPECPPEDSAAPAPAPALPALGRRVSPRGARTCCPLSLPSSACLAPCPLLMLHHTLPCHSACSGAPTEAPLPIAVPGALIPGLRGALLPFPGVPGVRGVPSQGSAPCPRRPQPDALLPVPDVPILRFCSPHPVSPGPPSREAAPLSPLPAVHPVAGGGGDLVPAAPVRHSPAAAALAPCAAAAGARRDDARAGGAAPAAASAPPPLTASPRAPWGSCPVPVPIPVPVPVPIPGPAPSRSARSGCHRAPVPALRGSPVASFGSRERPARGGAGRTGTQLPPPAPCSPGMLGAGGAAGGLALLLLPLLLPPPARGVPVSNGGTGPGSRQRGEGRKRGAPVGRGCHGSEVPTGQGGPGSGGPGGIRGSASPRSGVSQGRGCPAWRCSGLGKLCVALRPRRVSLPG